MLQQFAFSLRQLAEEAGTDCDAPGCNALTLGVRCANCSRRLCITHTYWNTLRATMTPFCPYCVLAQNSNLFDDGED
jgi:hypothetical protein